MKVAQTFLEALCLFVKGFLCIQLLLSKNQLLTEEVFWLVTFLFYDRFNLIFLESCTETDEACGAAECYIINGNRECLCFHGYSYDFTTKTCVDNNECASQGLFQFFKTYFPPFLTPNNLKWIKSCDFSQTEAC